MTDEHKIRVAAIRAAEAAAIAGIPKGVLERLETANAEYAANGGCPGCGSKVIAVHDGRCPELRKEPLW